MDWVCHCGHPTGSFLISECFPCQRRHELLADEYARILAAWKARIKSLREKSRGDGTPKPRP